MTPALLDHIWQSTLFAGVIWLLTLTFRRNGAAVRFWLWFAASIKFLVPFSALAALGDYLSRQYPASLPKSVLVLRPAAETFSAPAKMLVAPHAQTFNLAPLLLGIWLAGFAAILGLHLLRWVRLRAILMQARDLAVPAPVQIKASSSLLEPGLVGILRPAVLMPAGLMAFLSDAERDSILAHEISHLNRGDNVTAAIHMTVEALFWFYPPVWLIGGQLLAERERACDENVLASGHDPEVYAGGILKVCKFCIQSPLACVSGVSGADLGMRVRQIMAAEVARDVGAAKRLLLAGACLFTLAMPVMAGFVDTPLARQVKRNVMAVQVRAEQAVTAMVQQVGIAPQASVAPARLPQSKVTVAAVPPVLPDVEMVTPPPVAQVTAQQLDPPVAATAAPVSAPASNEAAAVLDARGDGDPDAMTCRAPQALPGSRLPGPQVCKTNRVWAQLRADGKDIGADGAVIPRSRSMTDSGCPRSALLGSFQSQNMPDGSVLYGCR